MFLDSGNENECYGCFACFDACARKAIEITVHDDTFLYPHIIKDKCISCSKCRKACPKSEASLMHTPIESFSGIIRDKESFNRSSSGGAFEAIVQAVMDRIEDDKQLWVAGVVWDDKLRVVHTVLRVKNILDIRPFNKSKYVQSNPSGTYIKISDLLKQPSNFVVFSGTPCQIDALYSFIGKTRPDNLLTIDLVCKGAPSQKFFDKYRYELECQSGSSLCEYSFRNKEILDNGTLYTRSAKYVFENGISKKVTRLNDPFLKIFYEKAYHVRPACLSCNYKQPNRIGDFTIGDAWGIEKKYAEINAIKGVSLITVNTPLAQRFSDAVKSYMDVYDTEYSFLVENNAALMGGGNTESEEIKRKLMALWAGINDKDTEFTADIIDYFNT